MKDHVGLSFLLVYSIYLRLFQLHSFLSLLYAEDSMTWKENLGPIGALEAFLIADKFVKQRNFISASVSIVLFL